MSDPADGGCAATRDDASMTYVSTYRISADIETFEALDAALPTTRPDGLLARYVGAVPDGVGLTVVWTDKAASDRFDAEILGPTLRRLHPEGAHGDLVLDFEATDVIVEPAG
jgi:hypothetical protein